MSELRLTPSLPTTEIQAGTGPHEGSETGIMPPASAAWARQGHASTFCQLLYQRARSNPCAPAMSSWDGTHWRETSWSEYRTLVAEASVGLRDLGLLPHDCVAIVAGNRPEHLIADQAITHAGGVPVTLYSTLSPEQIVYCVNDCRATLAILEDRAHLSRWLSIQHELLTLRHIIVMDPYREVPPLDDDPIIEAWTIQAVVPAPGSTSSDGPGPVVIRELSTPVAWEALLASGARSLQDDPRSFDECWSDVKPSHLACMVYTSGTTGDPKGVMLTHSSLIGVVEALTAMPGLVPEPHSYVSYLPYAHVAERAFSLYLPLLTGGHTYFCPDPTRLFEFVRRVRPTFFFGVPRTWEKFQDLVWAHARCDLNANARADFEEALEIGRRIVAAEENGEHVPTPDRERWEELDRSVLRSVRESMGFGACQTSFSGSAPVPPDVCVFAAALGIPLLAGYGLTETSCAVTMNPPAANRIGTVGVPLPGVEIRVGEHDEVQVRSALNTTGYFNLPKATASLYTKDNWLRTGDIGSIDEHGYLRIVGRIKELVITAYGKNIAPAPIEVALRKHPLIAQAIVVGEAKPFLSALLVLDVDNAILALREAGQPANVNVIERNPVIVRRLEEAVASVNIHLSQPEKIKRFQVLSDEWSADTGELTPSLKLRRTVIHDKYRGDIDALYKSSAE